MTNLKKENSIIEQIEKFTLKRFLFGLWDFTKMYCKFVLVLFLCSLSLFIFLILWSILI
jgi:hypothetical protein